MDITQAVAKMYEMYPYPHYPLLAKPVWQAGHLTSSLFSGRLLFDNTGIEPSIWHKRQSRKNSLILVVGSGEILPFVIRKWEPKNHLVHCIDLSQKNISRAKFRTALQKSIRFTKGDVHKYLENRRTDFSKIDHADAYGVIHHLDSPSQTLQALCNNMDNAGTARFMIYNGEARKWIHHLQSAFKALKLDFSKSQDLALAQKILQLMQDSSKNFADKTQSMKSTLANNSRFVDTFFHQREVRYSTKQWLQLLADSHFKIFGLFDRYAELDDLSNPLWQPPTIQSLCAKAEKKAFNNNLELFLTTTFAQKETNHSVHPQYTIPLSARLYMAPAYWFEYEETHEIGLKQRNLLWQKHLHTVFNRGHSKIDESFLPLASLQRLARLGAILPCQVDDALKAKLLAPMSREALEPKASTTDLTIQGRQKIESFIKVYLDDNLKFTPRIFDVCIRRILRAMH